MYFLHHEECGGETSPKNFFEKSKLSIYLDQQFEVSYSLFLWYIQIES